MNYVENCTILLNEVLVALGEKAVVNSDYIETATKFRKHMKSGGEKLLLENGQINKEEIRDFIECTNKLNENLQKEGNNHSDGKSTKIDSLRILNWIPTLSKSIPTLNSKSHNANKSIGDMGIKQVRATELVIRSLVTEKHLDQESLKAHILRVLNFDNKRIKSLERKAAANDIISGTDFSELIRILTSEFSFQDNYNPIFEKTPFLQYLQDKRKTLDLFLDDIRRIRNDIAHLRPLTDVQIELLSIYYEEIMTPIEEAHKAGNVHVNPKEHLNATDEEVNSYLNNISKDIEQIGKGVSRIDGNVSWIRNNTKYILLSLSAITIAAIFSLVLAGRIQDTTNSIKQDTEETNREISNTRASIEKDPSTLGHITLRSKDGSDGTAKDRLVIASIYLNAKGASLKDAAVRAAITSASANKSLVDLSAILRKQEGIDVQMVEFNVPSDAMEISICMTAEHPTLHRPSTGIWSFTIQQKDGNTSVARSSPPTLHDTPPGACQ